MEISELLFTDFGPFLYNCIFLSLWILWFSFHNKTKENRIRIFFNNYLSKDKIFYPLTTFIILIFLFLLFSYAIWNTDVDDAITSAVKAFLDGKNPYKEDVVEHQTSDGLVYGRYHYFPPDLLTYSLFYLLLGKHLSPILDTYWFVPLHFLFTIPGYLIVSRLVVWPHRKTFPFFTLLIIPFLFTNSMLMWFFFLIGYYLYEEKNHYNLGMLFYVLAASVKYMVGFIIFFYLVQSIKEILRSNSWKCNWQFTFNKLNPYFISSLVLALISFPFGFIDVIFSVFIYQGATSFRSQVAQSVGPLLIEILKPLSLESLHLPIAAIITVVSLFILRKQPTYDQILHFSFLAMLILPFYATELFITVPFYWWFKEGKDSFKNNKEENEFQIAPTGS